MNLNTASILIMLQDLNLLIHLVNIPDPLCHIPCVVQIHVFSNKALGCQNKRSVSNVF